ncbi:MAG TPA: hypothetical protein VFN48_00615 [Solirubrobacteraceae bacterium]|nr:hypothetical protein [Solirubrobacteraceae bacterium]
MQEPPHFRAADHDADEADAEAAHAATRRERASMPAREFVSERDALQDAWSGDDDRFRRDDGW